MNSLYVIHPFGLARHYLATSHSYPNHVTPCATSYLLNQTTHSVGLFNISSVGIRTPQCTTSLRFVSSHVTGSRRITSKHLSLPIWLRWYDIQLWSVYLGRFLLSMKNIMKSYMNHSASYNSTAYATTPSVDERCHGNIDRQLLWWAGTPLVTSLS